MNCLQTLHFGGHPTLAELLHCKVCRQGGHRSSAHCNTKVTTLQVYTSHDSQGQCAYPACPKKRFTSPAMQPSWSSKMKVSLSCKAGQEKAATHETLDSERTTKNETEHIQSQVCKH